MGRQSNGSHHGVNCYAAGVTPEHTLEGLPLGLRYDPKGQPPIPERHAPHALRTASILLTYLKVSNTVAYSASVSPWWLYAIDFSGYPYKLVSKLLRSLSS